MAVAGETDNPVVAADDAFGMTLGTETIGIYGPALVRGFNPQAAGNVRLDGLYFDQQAPLSNRVIEGSTIHVGISNTGYIFPAPTGIVDYTLRSGRGSSPAATLMAYAGPFDSTAVYLDASLPLLEQQIMIPIGGGAELQATAPGYTSRVYSFGTVPKWMPNEKITVRALLDWQRVSHERKEPFVFPSGDFIPPSIGGGNWGQNWSETRATMLNFGAMLGADLSEHWSMSAGFFRSISDSPVSYSDLYFNAQPSGSADHLVVGYPNQHAASTSGEVRLMRHASVGAWYHDVIVSMRGRDVRDIYGGSDVVDLGTISLGDTQQFPEPAFRYSARDTDHGDLSATGIIYRIQLPNKFDSSIGLQRYDYRKSDTLADGPQFRLGESTWRGYASLTYSLTEQVTAYTGYTQGLEDSGVSPSNAENRGAVLHATETWQVDAGLRYLMADRVKWLLGIFEINEPYFSIDQSNVDRELGAQQARGLEFSVSGQICPGLSIVGGAMITHVKVIGSDLTALGISSVAFGQSHNQFVLNADYRPEFWPALSVDFGFNRTGVTPASQDGTLGIPPFNIINVGGRYRFGILGHSASLRVQVSNLTNVYTWNVNSTPGFYRLPPRGFLAYLTVGV
jgi:iron complex outermembrane receptor protein